MALSLPVDAEPFVDSFDALHRPGVYVLRLDRPRDVATVWDQEFDVRPQWFAQFQTATRVYYVGAAADVLARLEQHAAGEKQPTLMQVCDIYELVDIVWYGSTGRAFEQERSVAQWWDEQRPNAFVHQR